MLFSVVRRSIAVPGRVVGLVTGLADDLSGLHGEVARASDEIRRTRRSVDVAIDRLDTLIELSQRAIGRMDGATDDMHELEDRADELQPVAEAASQTLDDVAAALDQVPGIDVGDQRG